MRVVDSEKMRFMEDEKYERRVDKRAAWSAPRPRCTVFKVFWPSRTYPE